MDGYMDGFKEEEEEEEEHDEDANHLCWCKIGDTSHWS